MAFLLDTNVVSELRKGQRADRHVIEWHTTVPESDAFISAITLLELEIGVRKTQRRDPNQGTILRTWVTTIVQTAFQGRILEFDARAANACAAFHVPDPASWRDSMIAATAASRGHTVVTRNVRDFQATGVRLLNPWEYQG